MDCFISYSKQDLQAAKQLKELLQLASYHVFLADDSISPGAEWSHLIRTAVKRCDLVILLDSASSRSSAWVQQEAGMALASGSILIPISLDGRLDLLPAWLGGFQALTLEQGRKLDEALSSVVEQIGQAVRVGGNASASGDAPQTLGHLTLRAVLLDQFSAPVERAGAWSRQYNRYLRMYYGDGEIHDTISQGASLTLTGMIVEKLTEYRDNASAPLAAASNVALATAAAFIVSSRDRHLGGFGRLSSEVGARAGRPLQLDMRHTCWAIRALLCIDPIRFRSEIEFALEWLCARAKVRHDRDRWCWTTAPILALTYDRRIASVPSWREATEWMRADFESALERSFDPNFCSWVNEEPQAKRDWLATDNALYVLYCLNSCGDVSNTLTSQRGLAIERLLEKASAARAIGAGFGLSLFSVDLPQAGPTAQLLEVMGTVGSEEQRNALKAFVEDELASARTFPQTFSWHLASILGSRSLSQTLVKKSSSDSI
jgi:hypothetical protein